MNVRNRTVQIVCVYVLIISLFLVGTAIGNRAVTVISEALPPERKYCIIIDAGHGGEDGGAISVTGKKESVFNLQIALRMDDLLHLMGCDTQMTRKEDTALYTKGETIAQKKVSDLKERTKMVNGKQNGVLISIHQNSFPEEKYSGAQIFYAKTSGSAEFAEQMQQSMISALNPGSKRQAKQGSGIYLLDKTTVPAILIECGFLTNSKEEHLLSTTDYQKKLCCVIASTAMRFLADS